MSGDVGGGARAASPMLWIAGLAIAVRALALLRTDPVAFDSATYFEMAAEMRAGRWAAALAYPYPPLFPALVAALQALGMGDAIAGLTLAFLADLLVLLPLAALARAAGGQEAAWAAAFLWAVHPYAVRLGIQALTDAPTALCVALALWFGLEALVRQRISWALAAGGASGLAYLLRPEGLEPALALGALYAIRPPARHTAGGPAARTAPAPAANGARRAAWAAAPLASFALVAAPYVAYISLEAGSLVLSKKKSPAAILAAVASPLTPSASPLTPHPSRLPPPPSPPRPAANQASPGEAATPTAPPRWTTNLYIFQRPLVNGIHPLVLALAALGGWRFGRSAEGAARRAGAFLVGLVALHLAVLAGLAAQRGPRYLGGHHFFLAALYLLPFAGAGLAAALAWARQQGRRRWLAPAIVVAVVGATVPQILLRGPGRGVVMRPAAEWIRAQGGEPLVVVTPLAKLTWLAGARRVEFGGPYDAIVAQARAHGARFLAVYPDMAAERSPDFLRRLDAGDLELARVFPEPSRSDPARRLEIYRVKPR